VVTTGRDEAEDNEGGFTRSVSKDEGVFEGFRSREEQVED